MTLQKRSRAKWEPSPQVASAGADAAIFCQVASLPGRHRGVRHVASLGGRFFFFQPPFDELALKIYTRLTETFVRWPTKQRKDIS